MKHLFLHAFHDQFGANFIQLQDYLLPADYGNVKEELEAANRRVGLLDRSYIGKIVVRGSDALDLLDRISTNDLHYLSVGTVTDTVFVTPKGRLIDYCRVINSGEDFILIGSFFKSSHLIDWINRFVILEDVEVIDATDSYIWLTLLGPYAQRFLTHFTDKDVTNSEDSIWLQVAGENVPALKNVNFNVPAYNLCIDKSKAIEILAELNDALLHFRGCLIGDTAFQIVRVESGMPDWGTEITQDYNPHEARLTEAVSFTKGCYTGQEVIARLDTYDKVQKYLMIIELDEKITHEPPLDLYIEDETIGQMTSYVYDPVDKRSVGLGYVKKMYAVEDDIYAEVDLGNKRIPAKLKLPPQAYREK
jgi:folate-binding protein YgfZ